METADSHAAALGLAALRTRWVYSSSSYLNGRPPRRSGSSEKRTGRGATPFRNASAIPEALSGQCLYSRPGAVRPLLPAHEARPGRGLGRAW